MIYKIPLIFLFQIWLAHSFIFAPYLSRTNAIKGCNSIKGNRFACKASFRDSGGMFDRTGNLNARGSDIYIDDFEQILESLKIFYSYYGRGKIPVSFEVPEHDPWPKRLHGLRLGKRLERLMLTKGFFLDYPKHVQALNDAGFVPTVDSLMDEFELVYIALKTYKKLYGDVHVAQGFAVPYAQPWPKLLQGLALGSKVSLIRNVGKLVEGNAERKKLLDQLGFEWGRKLVKGQALTEEEFESFCGALATYRAVKGNYLVPEDFVVERSDQWPAKYHGIQLGKLVTELLNDGKIVRGRHDRVQRLRNMGFTMVEQLAYPDSQNRRFEAIYDALVIFQKVYGTSDVPSYFVVPREDPWSRDTWELKLGRRLHEMLTRPHTLTQKRREALQALGYSVDGAKVEDAPRKYSSKKTANLEDTNFNKQSVPTQETALNKVLLHQPEDKRSSNDGNEADETVDAIGAWSRDAWKRASAILKERSAVIHSPYNNVGRMADDFVGGSAFKLGSLLQPPLPDEKRKAVMQLGYRILEFGKFTFDHFVDALAIFRLMEGHVDVPLDFAVSNVAKGAELYASRGLVSFPLGDAVNRMRIGDYDGYQDVERRRILDELGFVWGDRRTYQLFRFWPMVYALYNYLMLHPARPIIVPEKFVVPDEPAWPRWMVNIPLGRWVAMTKMQQQMITKHYVDRRRILNDLKLCLTTRPSENLVKEFWNSEFAPYVD